MNSTPKTVRNHAVISINTAWLPPVFCHVIIYVLSNLCIHRLWIGVGTPALIWLETWSFQGEGEQGSSAAMDLPLLYIPFLCLIPTHYGIWQAWWSCIMYDIPSTRGQSLPSVGHVIQVWAFHLFDMKIFDQQMRRILLHILFCE